MTKDNNDVFEGDNYRLTLPARAGGGTCVWAAPIPYLRNSQETCVWRMTSSLCSAASPLNALNYALPTPSECVGDV